VRINETNDLKQHEQEALCQSLYWSSWGTLLVAQLVEAMSYKPNGHAFDSRWCH
jgi:hypothetical protein